MNSVADIKNVLKQVALAVDNVFPHRAYSVTRFSSQAANSFADIELPNALTLIKPAWPMAQGEPPAERLVNGLGLLVLLVVVIICLAAFIVVLHALLPKVSERSKAALQQSPWRAFFIGLANYLFLGGVSLVLLGTEIELLSLIGLVIAAFLSGVTAIGFVGLVMLVGERLTSLHGQQISPLKQLIGGGVAVSLAGLLPLLGWFVLTPILLMLSFGAAVLAWRNRKQMEIGNW